MTEPLARHVINQREILDVDKDELKSRKAEKAGETMIRDSEKLQQLKSSLSEEKLKLLEAVSEVGASSWLTSLPLKKYGFFLEKQAFRDALFLRYGLPIPRLPTNCVCGSTFSVQHALTCARGGFTIIRHNDLRDFTAELLNEICHDVEVEPCLTPLSGESFQHKTSNTSDDARGDISARGLWARGQKTFMDVRVFNPLAKTYAKGPLTAAYKMNELEKKRAYNRRIIDIENATFTPLVFSCLGGQGVESSRFF